MENKDIFPKVKEPTIIFLPSYCHERRQFHLFKTVELHALGKFISNCRPTVISYQIAAYNIIFIKNKNREVYIDH